MLIYIKKSIYFDFFDQFQYKINLFLYKINLFWYILTFSIQSGHDLIDEWFGFQEFRSKKSIKRQFDYNISWLVDLNWLDRLSLQIGIHFLNFYLKIFGCDFLAKVPKGKKLN